MSKRKRFEYNPCLDKREEPKPVQIDIVEASTKNVEKDVEYMVSLIGNKKYNPSHGQIIPDHARKNWFVVLSVQFDFPTVHIMMKNLEHVRDIMEVKAHLANEILSKGETK